MNGRGREERREAEGVDRTSEVVTAPRSTAPRLRALKSRSGCCFFFLRALIFTLPFSHQTCVPGQPCSAAQHTAATDATNCRRRTRATLHGFSFTLSHHTSPVPRRRCIRPPQTTRRTHTLQVCWPSDRKEGTYAGRGVGFPRCIIRANNVSCVVSRSTARRRLLQLAADVSTSGTSISCRR